MNAITKWFSVFNTTDPTVSFQSQSSVQSYSMHQLAVRKLPDLMLSMSNINLHTYCAAC